MLSLGKIQTNKNIKKSIYEKRRFRLLLVPHPHSFAEDSADSDKNTLGAPLCQYK